MELIAPTENGVPHDGRVIERSPRGDRRLMLSRTQRLLDYEAIARGQRSAKLRSYNGELDRYRASLPWLGSAAAPYRKARDSASVEFRIQQIGTVARETVSAMRRTPEVAWGDTKNRKCSKASAGSDEARRQVDSEEAARKMCGYPHKNCAISRATRPAIQKRAKLDVGNEALRRGVGGGLGPRCCRRQRS